MALKLTAIQTTITRATDVPGFIKGGIQYEIRAGKSDAEWTGPKISRAVWNEILAFFQDTYNRTHSECQVRLYANKESGLWAAWAYPQEAKTGMSARELPGPATATQREQFKESDGWFYLGTVHHHCAASAFQSGADRDNEKGQDGLHITVGKMDERQHDLHARFYLAGSEFQPDMSDFWDIGDDLRRMTPKETHDSIARFQMTIPAEIGSTYPDQWKENLIEIKTPFFDGRGNGASGSAVGNGSTGGCSPMGINRYPGSSGSHNVDLPHMKRRENAFAEAKRLCQLKEITPDIMNAVFALLETDETVEAIRKAAGNNQVAFSDVVEEWKWDRDICEQFGQTGMD